MDAFPWQEASLAVNQFWRILAVDIFRPALSCALGCMGSGSMEMMRRGTRPQTPTVLKLVYCWAKKFKPWTMAELSDTKKREGALSLEASQISGQNGY